MLADNSLCVQLSATSVCEAEPELKARSRFRFFYNLLAERHVFLQLAVSVRDAVVRVAEPETNKPSGAACFLNQVVRNRLNAWAPDFMFQYLKKGVIGLQFLTRFESWCAANLT